jgi:hypothetical protein
MTPTLPSLGRGPRVGGDADTMSVASSMSRSVSSTQVGLSLPGGVRLVTRIPAVIN